MGLGCEICGLSFSRQLAILDHYKSKHKIILREKKVTRKPPAKKITRKKHVRTPSLAVGDDGVTNNGMFNQQIRGSAEHDMVPEQFTLSVGGNQSSGNDNEETFVAEAISTDFSTNLSTDRNKGKEDITETNMKIPVDMNETVIGNAVEVEETVLKSFVNVEGAMDTNENDGKNIDCYEFVERDKVVIRNNLITRIEDEGNITEPAYVLEGTREETVVETVLVPKPNNGSSSGSFVEEPVHTSEPGVSDRNTYREEKVMSAEVVAADMEETGVCDIEIGDMGNSNSSEKENNNEESHGLHDQPKLKDSAPEKMVKLSHSIKELAVELNMPDFHFISVIDRKGLRGQITGGKYSFKCLYCNLKVSWRSTLCRHMREKHADILKVGSLITIPEKVHRDHKVMKMSDYIRMETRPSGKRMRGIETQDLPGEYLCDKCDKIFHRLRYLRKHQLVHKKEKNLLCSVCVKTFKTLPNLKQHMKSHRDREAYKCSECDFESTVNIAIHTHRQIHSQGCVLCETCGSAYSDKSTLTKHKEVHNPLRPFACEYPGCTWRFKSKMMCEAHLRAHTSKGKFDCSICGYAFRQKHHLQRHEKKIHNINTGPTSTYSYMKSDYSRDQELRLESTSTEEVQEVSLVVNEANGVSVDTVDDQFDLESALQTGQLVIATEDGNAINYEMPDIGINMSYQTLLQDGEGAQLDAHTILIPQSDGSHIIYQQDVTETPTSR